MTLRRMPAGLRQLAGVVLAVIIGLALTLAVALIIDFIVRSTDPRAAMRHTQLDIIDEGVLLHPIWRPDDSVPPFAREQISIEADESFNQAKEQRHEERYAGTGANAGEVRAWRLRGGEQPERGQRSACHDGGGVVPGNRRETGREPDERHARACLGRQGADGRGARGEALIYRGRGGGESEPPPPRGSRRLLSAPANFQGRA